MRAGVHLNRRRRKGGPAQLLDGQRPRRRSQGVINRSRKMAQDAILHLLNRRCRSGLSEGPIGTEGRFIYPTICGRRAHAADVAERKCFPICRTMHIDMSENPRRPPTGPAGFARGWWGRRTRNKPAAGMDQSAAFASHPPSWLGRACRCRDKQVRSFG